MRQSEIYDWLGLNKMLFLLINKIHAPVFDEIMLAMSWLGHPRLYPLYMVAVLLLAWKKPAWMPVRNVVVFSISYVLTSIILIPMLKVYFDFPRPWAVLGMESVVLLGESDSNHAFPSGHAAYVVLMAASLRSAFPLPGRRLILVFAVLGCFSRISVGAHFPSDVAAGVMISLLIVWLVRKLLRA